MARKITTSTDKYGRTVYKITGTKKYAFSLAKAKKIAASLDGGAVRKPAKKTARKATRRPAKRTTAVTRYRGRGGKADSRYKGYDGLEMDEPMTAAERRAVLAAAKAGNRKRKPAKRTAPKRNASGQFVKRKAAKKTTRRNGNIPASDLKALHAAQKRWLKGAEAVAARGMGGYEEEILGEYPTASTYLGVEEVVFKKGTTKNRRR
jgi:hypothetical protein